ncbi:MAG: hypothetical protein WA908_05640 [Pontixanthobacter sp.]
MIDQFRKCWTGTSAASAADAMSFGGRARGRVALWALERAAAILRSSARAQMRLNDVGDTDLSHQERVLVETVSALKADDYDRAEMQAQWLVKSDAVHRLLRSLAPLADTVSVQRASAA